MNTEILKNAGIDYDGGVKRFMGRDHLYMKTLSKFPKNDAMERIRTDYKEHDMDALLRDCHEFKGMCGNMSMTQLYSTANEIVMLLRSDETPDEKLTVSIKELEREYAIARDAILAVTEVPE